MNGLKKNAYSTLVEKPEGKRPLERQRHIWVDNINMEIRQAVAVWTRLIWLRTGTGGL
jgi:hypothetical protein